MWLFETFIPSMDQLWFTNLAFTWICAYITLVISQITTQMLVNDVASKISFRITTGMKSNLWGNPDFMNKIETKDLVQVCIKFSVIFRVLLLCETMGHCVLCSSVNFNFLLSCLWYIIGLFCPFIYKTIILILNKISFTTTRIKCTTGTEERA